MKRPSLGRPRSVNDRSAVQRVILNRCGASVGEQILQGLQLDLRADGSVDGGVAKDFSGRGNIDVPETGNCLSFDGLSDVIDCGNKPSLQITGSLSVFAWVKTNSFANHNIVAKFRYAPTNSRSYAFQVRSDGRIRLALSNNGVGTTHEFYTTETVSPNVWHHIGFFLNIGNDVQIFLDGKSVLQSSSVPSSLFNSDESLWIGAENAGNSTRINGCLSDVCLYANFGSSEDAEWAFEKRVLPHQRPGSVLDSSDLKGSWRLSESFFDAEYTLVFDGSGNGNHARNVNGGATPLLSEEIIPQLAARGFTRGIRFDSTNDYISATPPETSLATDFTWSCIVSQNSFSSSQPFLKWEVDSNDRIHLKFGITGVLQLLVTSSTLNESPTSNYTANLNDPITVAVVHDATAKSFTFYVNGNSQGSGTYTGTFGVGSAATWHMPASLREGILDEIAWFDTTFDATEVAELHNSGLPIDARKHSLADNLIGYWRNGWLTASGEWEDLSSNNNNGTVNGSPDNVILQALPGNPDRHVLGGFVRENQGVSFAEAGALRLLGPNSAKGSEQESWWTEVVNINVTFSDGFAAINYGAAYTAMLRRDNQLVVGEYYYFTVDVSSYTSGSIDLYFGNGVAQNINGTGRFSGVAQCITDGRVQFSTAGFVGTINLNTFRVSPLILNDHFVGGGTASAWIKPYSHGQNDFGRIFSVGVVTDTPSLRMGLTGQLVFRQGFSPQYGQWRTNNVLTLGVWNHVAVVYTADTAELPVFYVNGQVVTTVVSNIPSGTLSTTNKPLKLGNDESLTRGFDGVIDRPTFWSRRLSKTEIYHQFSSVRNEYGV